MIARTAIRCIKALGMLSVLLLVIGVPASDVTATPARDTQPGAGADQSMVFTSAGCMLRFDPDGLVVASPESMLRVDFLSACGGAPGSEPGKEAGALGRVTYPELWPGVTLVYEAIEDGLAKSTYFLDDAGAAGAIHLRYNRPVSLDDDGNLLVTFDIGTMVESAPIAWQVIDGHRKPVTAAYSLYSEREVGFALGDCVPGIPVVIDPSLTWNTFLGGSSDDDVYAIAVDGDGNVYVSGYSFATWGSPERAYAGYCDAFAAKLGSSGDLIWNTFLGSASEDRAYEIAVDDDGNVYVSGYSDATWGSPEQAYAGNLDAFAAKLDSAGNLIWNTFLGGASHDRGYAIAVDGDGNVYVGGESWATWSSPQQAHAGEYDAFAAKLDSDDGALIWNTFLGGSSDDFGLAIAVDSDGNVYVSGYSSATWGSPQQAHAGEYDAFAAKLDSSGDLIWNTFLGSSGNDTGYAVAVDSDGNVYVSGFSNATWGSPQQAHAGEYDAFAAKLDSDDGSLIWNTFLGGSSRDMSFAIAVDDDGNVYVGGYSNATWGSPQPAHAGGYDAFAARLDSGGALTWNAFLGGSGDDYGLAIAVDGDGNVYVGGESSATWSSPQRPYTDITDAFAAKLASSIALDLDLKTGWNMVSVPVEASDMSVGSVFPDVAAVYTWDPVLKSYSAPTTIEVGAGYWVAVTENTTIPVSGTPVTEWTRGLSTGWNMIGSVYGDPVDVDDADEFVDDPSGTVQTSAIYTWNPTAKSYQVAFEIEQGLGYWAACSGDCDLTMTAPV